MALDGQDVNIDSILTAIAKNMEDKLGDKVVVYDLIPEAVSPPCVWARPNDGDYYTTHGSLFTEHHIIVTVLVERSDLESAQNKLRPFLAKSGPYSIKEAIELDPRLGGLASQVVCWRYGKVGAREFARVQYFGADLEVTVYEADS